MKRGSNARPPLCLQEGRWLLQLAEVTSDWVKKQYDVDRRIDWSMTDHMTMEDPDCPVLDFKMHAVSIEHQ